MPLNACTQELVAVSAGGAREVRGLAGALRDRASLKLLAETLGRGTDAWRLAMASPAADR